MNETTTLPSRKKQLSEAVLGNGKPGRQKVKHIPENDSSEAHSRLILATIVAFRDGDFSVRLPADWTGMDAQIAEAFNQTIAKKEHILKEVTRLSATVGKEGRLRQRMSLPGAIGAWADGGGFHEYTHRRSCAAHDRNCANHRRSGQGRPRSVDGPGGGRAVAEG